MFNLSDVFSGIAMSEDAGEQAALVTITAVTGSSSRNPGTQIAVSSGGRLFGSLSGGCIEQAVVAEALQAMNQMLPREVRYGQGSRYIDIRLPCGGAIDLLINPLGPPGLGRALVERLRLRGGFGIALPRRSGVPQLLDAEPTEELTIADEQVILRYCPPLRLVVAGHGGAVDCLRDIARASGIDTIVLSPDRELVARSSASGAQAHWLQSLDARLPLPLDGWTAFAMMFHDHDWEPSLLVEAVNSPAFFVGAMGSRRTHADRVERLVGLGLPRALTEKIVSPIGLIPSLRDPETLAISVLAQVVEQFNRHYA